jgi:hypothetical protein
MRRWQQALWSLTALRRGASRPRPGGPTDRRRSQAARANEGQQIRSRADSAWVALSTGRWTFVQANFDVCWLDSDGLPALSNLASSTSKENPVR